MRRSAVAAWCAGMAALAVIGTAGAPQNVPRHPPAGTQIVPKDPGAPSAPGARADNCSLEPISTADLDALRGVILELLAKHEAARGAFIRAEAKLPQDCMRARAIFYLRSLPLAKAAG